MFVHEINDKEPGKFIEVNDTACKRLGYSREEFLKMTPADIEARINNSEPLKFILDSGAGRNIITSLYNKEIYLNNTETVLLAGLGEGDRLEAFRSTGNRVQIERISGENVDPERRCIQAGFVYGDRSSRDIRF